ncbi:MAG: DMT family transporter [Rhodospirillales bacterium]
MTLSRNLQGAVWIIGSCAAATVLSLGIKVLAGAIHSVEITFVRCALGLLILAPLILRFGGVLRVLRSEQWKLQVLRGVLAVIAINCGFYALTELPLTTATVLFFTAPLFVTLFAPMILKERVGWRRYAATAAGFTGVLIVIRPGMGAFDPNMLIAVLSALCFSFSLIINKILSETDTPLSMMVYFALLTAVFSFPPAVFIWTWPGPWEWAALTVIAVTATIRNYCDIKGYGAGEVSFVAPFQYTRILFIAAAAYFAFGEVPDIWTVTGAGVIIASTLYIARRESVLGKVLQAERPPLPPASPGAP